VTLQNRVPREREAEMILRELGIIGASVQSAGHDGEVAVLFLSASHHDLLFEERRLEVAERLKRLGFRYVALDLQPAG
jgi:PP-loop superfamily ATP-utilizing enzyme